MKYGTVIGIVTLENVLEEIIGDVADEFDIEDPDIVPDGPEAYIVSAVPPWSTWNAKLGLSFGEVDVDTISGLMMHFAERLVSAGDVVDLEVATAIVLEVSDDRATRVRILLNKPAEAD